MGRPLRRSPIVILESPVDRAACLTLLYFRLLTPSTASSTSCSQRSSSLNVLFDRGICVTGRGLPERKSEFQIFTWWPVSGGWPVTQSRYLVQLIVQEPNFNYDYPSNHRKEGHSSSYPLFRWYFFPVPSVLPFSPLSRRRSLHPGTW